MCIGAVGVCVCVCCGFEQVKEDGCFWMELGDVRRFFNRVDICRVEKVPCRVGFPWVCGPKSLNV